MLVSRRGIIRGLFAAPAIIAADRLMPIKPFAEEVSSRQPGVYVKEIDLTYRVAASDGLPPNWVPYRSFITDSGFYTFEDVTSEIEFHRQRAIVRAT
jgi:hypothetical protein